MFPKLSDPSKEKGCFYIIRFIPVADCGSFEIFTRIHLPDPQPASGSHPDGELSPILIKVVHVHVVAVYTLGHS
jgi:hypothetical protein